MNILDTIILSKHKEVALKKETAPISKLERSFLYGRTTTSLAKSLHQSKHGIIAEFKRRSPSKPRINATADVQEVVQGYQKAGVSGISLLTDTEFFGGSLQDLLLARVPTPLPILRKDFIVDPYQIYEAKSYGADAILLIAAALTKTQLKEFSALAKELKLDVLLEVHSEEELKKSLHPTVDMIGVNNRDLKTFTTSIETSKRLASFIPNDFVKVSESGINDPEAIKSLKQYGFEGFLIGEHFMKQEQPGEAALQFITQL
jgi:indole-3-glycerol phosphate synthase